MATFLGLLQAEDVRSYLEIGARAGVSFDEIMRSLPKGSRGIAVDLPGAAWGADGSRGPLRDIVNRLTAGGYDCEVVFGASQSERVIAAVEQRGPYDAVFIDADHRYDSVAADWNNYGRLGRIVAFHDIAGVGICSGGLQVEVPRLWSEIKAEECRHEEIVAPGSILGIGVIWMMGTEKTPA